MVVARRGGRVPPGSAGRVGVGYSAGWSWERGETGERGDELGGPGPVRGDPQAGTAAAVGDTGDDVQESVAQFLGFGDGQVAVQQQGLGPGE